MSAGEMYRKYQVYFFLYLAVICELLIVIVERDDAEEVLLRQQRELKYKNQQIIKELLKNQPNIHAASDNTLEVGETRSFTVSVKGLGEKDDITVPPTVFVFKGTGAELADSHKAIARIYPEPLPSDVVGQRLYGYDYKAVSAGQFTFKVTAGTNRIAAVSMEGHKQVKVGSLFFDSKTLDEVISKDDELKGMLAQKGYDVSSMIKNRQSLVEGFISKSASLDPSTFVLDVISNPVTEQLVVRVKNITTAVGFETFAPLAIQGTSPDKVSGMFVSEGNVESDNSGWRWVGKLDKAGTTTVSLNASDKRGGNSLSKYSTQFTVTAKTPYLAADVPSAYLGEIFTMNLKVAGLEDNALYEYRVLVDGVEKTRGTGSSIRYKLPDVGTSLEVRATYADKTYPYIEDSAAAKVSFSNFVIPMWAPIERLREKSFHRNGEYPINNAFTFLLAKCGRCSAENMQPVEKFNLEVVDDNGRDLLESFTVTPRVDGATGKPYATFVDFWLRKVKVSKDGTDATIIIKFGNQTERFPIVLFPD